jgi:hypothetical protein
MEKLKEIFIFPIKKLSLLIWSYIMRLYIRIRSMSYHLLSTSRMVLMIQNSKTLKRPLMNLRRTHLSKMSGLWNLEKIPIVGMESKWLVH